MLACDLTAITEAERPRYQTLCARLRDSILERRELPNGYAFRLDSNLVALVDAAQWISLERLCCPFLSFEVRAAGTEPDFWLSVKGPLQAKPIIAEAFGVMIRKDSGL